MSDNLRRRTWNPMSVLSIDFETRSTLPLNKTGVYPYAQHDTTDIWCMAYAFDDEPVELLRFAGNMWDWVDTWGQERIVKHVQDGGEIRAWNAQFERIIWNEIMVKQHCFPPLVLEQVFDTAADAAALALPRGLDKAARVLGLDARKDQKGHRLMMRMAKPRPPRKDEDPDALLWWDDEDRRERLYAYCKQDVEVERAIGKRLRKLSPDERRVYLLDQEMNDRGVMLDMPLIHAAQKIVVEGKRRANDELDEVTSGKVSAVTKVKDLTKWLQYRKVDTDNVRKDTLRDLLDGDGLPEDVRRALEIRRDSGKTSTAKLAAMVHAACDDDRARGLLLYHGASTGRWSGKLLQPQNFPRPTVEDIEGFIPQVMKGLYGYINIAHPPLVVVSSMLRSMLRAAPGHRFMAGDYSQIEARVVAWIAGQEDQLAVFERGGKIYEEMASFIYGIPVEEIGEDSEERQVGKGAILGGGFGMGADKFAAQTKKQTGIELDRGEKQVTYHCNNCKCFTSPTKKPHCLDSKCEGYGVFKKEKVIREDMAQKAIDAYREKNKRIKEFWYDINNAAMAAVRDPGRITTVGRKDAIRYVVRGQFLWCQLPSKRFLAYAMPTVQDRQTPWGEWKPAVSYMGVDSQTRQWRRHDTYGGHLTENVVQAIARDLIAGGMLRLNEAGYRPLLSVHDEVICETPDGLGSMEEFLDLLTYRPQWAEGLPVAATGWEGQRYRK